MTKPIGVLWIFLCFFTWGSIVEAETEPQLIIINKGTNELAYYENGELVKVFKVATGRSNNLTPEGTFRIVNKIKNRPYYKDKIPGGDPRNPLGDRWLGLEARGTYGTTYAIHGNNNPEYIGTYASAGCVRMYDDEVRWLFEQVNKFTTVIITNSSKSFDAIATSHGYEPYSKLKTVNVDKRSPQAENSEVTIKALTTNKNTSLFKFLVFDGGNWITLQDFSTSNQFVWQPPIAGSYQVKVQVKSTSSEKLFDDEKIIPFEVFVSAKINSVSFDKEGPQPINTAINLKANSNDKNQNLLKFSILNGTEWLTLREFSMSANFTWTPTEPGNYKIKIETKNKLSSEEAEDEIELSYTIFQPAVMMSVAASKNSPQPIGTSLSFIGSTNDESANLVKFLIFNGEKWATVQDFSRTTKLNWIPETFGEYQIKIQTKHELSSTEFDDEETIEFTVFTPATFQGVASTIEKFIHDGDKVNLKLEELDHHEYRISILHGEKWSVMREYNTESKFNWQPESPGIYRLKIEVKHQLSSKEYDDKNEFLFIVYASTPFQAVVERREKIRRIRVGA
ncbi:L,D-transpeptidase family protein [Cytobacillus suaedae]|nr:L,D-transpeptidase family protein [Cytobacillus suaedae]